MADTQQTIAVIGSSPFAALLAGLMACDHSRAVSWVRNRHRPTLLARGIFASIAPVTRPETWHVLDTTRAETVRRLSRIDSAMVSRGDALFYARADYPRTALLHMSHIAAGFGHVVERDVTGASDRRLGLRIRDALVLDEARYWRAILPWLESCGVQVIDDTVSVQAARGRVGDLSVDQVVLADDEAILAHVDARERAAIGNEVAYRSVLTGSTASLPAPLVFDLDTEVAMTQRANGSLQIVACDGAPSARNRIAATLGTNDAQRAGEVQFVAIATRDNAPAFAPLRRSRAIAVAGLGPTGFFLAPAVARHLCASTEPREAAWFAAHTVGKASTGIAEFGAVHEVGS